MQALSAQDLNARYTLTERGRYDLIFAAVCQCDPKLKGLVVQCASCDTVYGYLDELDRSKTPRRRGRRW